MIQLISELLLFFHFSLFFSIALLCTILFIKIRDLYIRSFLRVIYPLFIYILIVFLYHYTDKGLALFTPVVLKGLSLYIVILVCIVTTLFLHGTASFVIFLLITDEKLKKLSHTINNLICIMFLLFGLFFLIFLTDGDWLHAVRLVLNEFFTFSSLLILIPTIFASVFMRINKDKIIKKNKRLLSQIMITFYPLVFCFPLDLFFFRQSPYKLTYLSYTLFCLFAYLFIFRHYINNYEPEKESLLLDINRFYKKNDISTREQEIISLIIEGRANKEIAEELFISYNTVKTHIKHIYEKLSISNRVQLFHKIKSTPHGDTENHA